MGIFFVMQKVTFHITGISIGFPVVLRMYQNLVIESFVKIQHRLQNLIFYLDQTQCLIDCFFRLTDHDRHRITDTAYSLIEDQTVIRRWLRISLSGNTETFFRHIFPGVDGFNARNLGCCHCFDLFYQSMGMRTSEQFYDQTVLRHNIIHENRVSEQKLV